MILVVLLCAYLVVGLLLALWRVRQVGADGDTVFLVIAWPVLLPFVLGATSGGEAPSPPLPPGHPGAQLQAAVARAAGTPLADLLPDQRTVTDLVARLQHARRRCAELDALCASPQFTPSHVREQIAALRTAGSGDAALAAEGRLQNIERLHVHRDHARAGLDAIEELLRQLHVQAELVRISGDASAWQDVLADVRARIEGLDAVLDPELRLP